MYVYIFMVVFIFIHIVLKTAMRIGCVLCQNKP